MTKFSLSPKQPRLFPLGEEAVLAQFANEIGEEWLVQVASLHQELLLHPFPGMREIVPAYASLAIYYDPLEVLYGSVKTADWRTPSSTSSPYEQVCRFVEKAWQTMNGISLDHHRTVTLPVCYGGEYGPDLLEVASYHGLTADEVIRLHSEAAYRVYLIGFLPGFAYMGGLPAELHTPRLATPRKEIAAGSVGIAGAQTGIYPLASPGGWQLIGRTPLPLFDPAAAPPSLLRAGDIVRFQPVTRDEYQKWQEDAR
ncbi:5-oxoprolinase subunit PxpB [Paenibacillus senegalensis]|uniref:5-oxoprolinase subunit PxpB n=1 Tax=Paenibacillus senegalensis TaxID=1465766 RepID=UPI0005A9AFF7|nr:5-oxoprolinase subunit PxpB [Paenibacillus senegalensis]